MGKSWTRSQGKPSAGPPCLPSLPPSNPSREWGIPGLGDKGRGSWLLLRASCYPAPSIRGRLGYRGRSLSPSPAQPHLSRQTLPAAKALSVHNVRTGLQLPFIIHLVRNVQDGGVRPGRQKEGRARPGGRISSAPPSGTSAPPAWSSHTLSSCLPAHCIADSFSYSFCCWALLTTESRTKCGS